MTIPYPCPSWCQGTPGHCTPEPDGPGDCHYRQIADIAISDVPGLREVGDARLVVKIEQYVTTSKTNFPMVTIDFGDRGASRAGYEWLTSAEAASLATAILQAEKIISLATNS